MSQTATHAPEAPKLPSQEHAPELGARELLLQQLIALQRSGAGNPDRLTRIAAYLKESDAVVTPVIAEYIARLRQARPDAEALWQKVSGIVDNRLQERRGDATMQDMKLSMEQGATQAKGTGNRPIPKPRPAFYFKHEEPQAASATVGADSKRERQTRTPQQPDAAQAQENPAAPNEATSRQDTSPAETFVSDKTYEKTGIGAVSSIAAARRAGLPELQRAIRKLTEAGKTQEAAELKKTRDALAHKTVLHGAARVSLAEAQKRRIAEAAAGAAQEQGNTTPEHIAALQKEIAELKATLNAMQKQLEALQGQGAPEPAPNTPEGRQNETDADTPEPESAPSEPEQPTPATDTEPETAPETQPNAEAPEQLPQEPGTPEEAAVARMRQEATQEVAKRLGLNIAEGKIAEATAYFKGMPRWKRALLWGGIGIAAAGGAMAAGFAGAALLGWLGLSASLSSASGIAAGAGLLAGKALGAWGGHKGAKKLAEKLGYGVERAQGAAAIEKVERAAERALRRFRQSNERAAAMNAAAGSEVFQAPQEIPAPLLGSERVKTLVDKSMRRSRWMPAIASVLATGAAGALWHWYSAPAEAAHAAGTPATAGSGAPQAPAQPAASGAAAGGSPAPAAPAAPQAPTPPHAPTPAAPPHAPATHASIWESTASSWADRVPGGQPGVLGSELSVDKIAGHIDTLTHAPTSTEAFQDLFTKAALKIKELAPLAKTHHPGFFHDINTLSEVITQHLGANGDLHSAATARMAPGAAEVLKNINVSDIDLWKEGVTYNLRGAFKVPEFVDAIRGWIDAHPGAFKNPGAMRHLLDTIVKHA